MPPSVQAPNARRARAFRNLNANPTDPDAIREDIESRAELKAQVLQRRIEEAAAKWPPLTEAQRDQLALLLRGT